MTDFRDAWKIGTISYVDQRKIKFRTSSTDISDRLFNGISRHLNSLNQYLYSFLNISKRIVFKVVSIEEVEKAYSQEDSSKFSDKYVFTAFPIGEIVKNKFKPGVIDIPMVGSNVYACDADDLADIFSNHSVPESNKVEIGELSGYQNTKPLINLDDLFFGHMAILGNTGSGKSTTARLLIKLISNHVSNIKDNAKFVVFDLHGDYEYMKANDGINYLSNNDYALPVGKLNIEDWSSILSPSERVQRPLLERAIKYSFLNKEGRNKLYASFSYKAINDTSVDSHSSRKFQIVKYYQNIQDKLQITKNTVIIDKEEQKIKNAKELMDLFSLHYGNVSDDVVDQLKTILSNYLGNIMEGHHPNIDKILDEEDLRQSENEITIDDVESALEFVFAEEEVSGNRQARAYSEGLVTQLHNLRDKYSDNLFKIEKSKSIIDKLNSKINIIDVSQIIDDDGLKIFSNFITRHLFEKNRNSTNRNDSPIYLILDEAHRYVKEGMISDDSIFNRVAREGRKFGIHLTVISQIPSELSRVVLSQTSTFIIHRIQNSVDLEYIRKNVPAISNDQVNRLPYFAPGMAVILGSAIKVPMELIIDGTYKDATPPISMMK